MKVFACLILLALPLSVIGQTPLSANKKAMKAFEKGQQVQSIDQLGALRLFIEATSHDSLFAEAYLKIGQMYDYRLERDKALFNYEKALALKPIEPTFAPAMQKIGDQYLRMGKYQIARKYFENYLKAQPLDNMQAKRVKNNLAKCIFATEALTKPMILNSKLLDFKGFNSFAVLTADNETMVFTELMLNEDLKVSRLINGEWSKPVSISDEINTSNNEGTCTISGDGRTLVFTSCNRPGGFGGCDLYISSKEGNQWQKPKNLGITVNTTFWESQPSLSADGKTLYFSSDRPKGNGGKDLYVSTLDSLNTWSVPQNLGKGINSPQDDISPFIHANGKSLFFASDGHLGFGGQDFFLVNLSDNQAPKPSNLGYPLNNAEDQIGLYISPNCEKGYYTSDNKAEGFHENSFEPNRKLKIIEFAVPDTLCKQIIKTIFVKGQVKNALTNQPVMATIEVFDLKTQQKISEIFSEKISGNYTTVLNNGGKYALVVAQQGFLFKSVTFELDSATPAVSKILDIALEPIQKNQKEVLNNVFFTSGKYDLEPSSNIVLEKLLKILNENPSVSIEISGHTDDQGKDEINQKLSLMRAKSVAQFLVKSGISAQRIKTEGHGKMKPMVANDTEENRKLNRRIEIKIL